MKITENTLECGKQNKDTITNCGNSVEHERHRNGQSDSKMIEKDNINTISVNYETAVYENRTYGGVGGR